MKKIKIVRGTYGMQKPNSFGVDPKSPDDPPFDIADDEAERLVELGVAKYCTGAPDEPALRDGDRKAGTGKIMETLSLNQIARLNKETHERLAKRLNVDLSATTNKDGRAKVIWDELERLNAAVAEVTEGVYEVVEEAETIDDDEDTDVGAGGNTTDGEDADDEDTDDEDTDDGAGGEDPPTVGAEAPVD